MTLDIAIHDYDEADLGDRYRRLRAQLPDARIDPYTSRQTFLQDIAARRPHRPGEQWPLALIDLHHDDRLARGEHLLATISEHPKLTDRVVLVAFTRYGHRSRDEIWKAAGVRAVLSPDDLEAEALTPEQLNEELNRLAEGITAPSQIHRLGEPPSTEDDRNVLAFMTGLFPDLLHYENGSPEQWERARQIWTICRLFKDGYPQTTILRQLGIKREVVDRLREQLDANRTAFRLGIVKPGSPTADLGGVVDAIQPHLGRSRAIWEITIPRQSLDGADRLKWLKERIDDRYPPGVADAGRPPKPHEEPWIPPQYLPWLRRFIEVYTELRTRKKGNPKPDVDLAIKAVASEFKIEPAQARHGVVHAVLCLEDAEADEPPQD